jgi:HD-GYP domain-containing protein (c-di-GMP phosphodiesterase class II)/DNA-binding CsgD family transcriptional regulator
VIAAFSLATDLGTGEPLQHGLRACLLAMQFGSELRLGPAALRELFYVALLQRIGCTANTVEVAAWFADDLAAHARTYTLDFGRPLAVIGDLLRHAGAGKSPGRRVGTIGGALAGGRTQLDAMFRASCEVAERLTEQLGFAEGVRRAVGQAFERWDGRGFPAGRRGEVIALPMRIARLATDGLVFYRLGGADFLLETLHRRSGTVFDPALVELFARRFGSLLSSVEVPSAWEAVLAAEPMPSPRLAGAELDLALEVMAHFADLKLPWFTGHSTAVADLAARAGHRAELGPVELTRLRRAGLVHDLGRVGVSAAVWGAPGPLDEEAWERVRLHPYLTERVLARPEALASVGSLASLHHERADGSGYHRGLVGRAIPVSARLLAAADVYQAMREPRPHRPARPAAVAAAELRAEATAGRLDAAAVAAVLSAVGQPLPRRGAYPAGLSEREVEVLRLVARGWTNRRIAERLSISSHTAGHHVRHIYDKIGVATRAGATLFAMEHDLVGADPMGEE